jgi:hypothetical protein
MNENLGNLNEMFKAFGSQTRGRRAFGSQAFIEKSNGEGKAVKTWSVTRDRSKIEKALMNLIEKATEPEDKTKFENALISYNASGMSNALASVYEDIEKANEVEIIK